MVHIDDGRVLGSTSVFVRLTQLVGPVTESSNGFGVHACSSLCDIIYIVSVFGTIRGYSRYLIYSQPANHLCTIVYVEISAMSLELRFKQNLPEADFR